MSISDFAEQKPKEPTWDTQSTTSTEPQETSVTASPAESITTEAPSPTTVVDQTSTPTVTETEQPAVDEILKTLMGNIHDIGQKESFKILIYGDPGTTKSSFAATAPNNLIVDLDEGLISAKSSPNGIATGTKSFPWMGFNGLSALIGKLNQNPEELAWIETLTIDPFSEVHKRGLDEVLAREHAKAPGTFNRYKPETDHHQENNNRMLTIIRALKDLDRNLIITAHAKTVEPKNKPSKTFPDFSESLANKIEGMMDIVGYMTRREIDGQMVPILRVVTDGTVHAKTRVPLPVEIIDPKWPQLKAAWDKMLATN